MEHSEAVQLMATERYLLGELTGDDRERFEEHLFSCQDCALDVRTAASFLEHSKVTLANPAVAERLPAPIPAKPARAWRLWPALAAAALVLLVGVIGYQNTVQYPALKSALAVATTPQILPSAVLVSSRDVTSPVVRVPRSSPFLLLMDIPDQAGFASYVVELHNAEGTMEWTLPIAATAAHDTISIRVPGVERNGEYVLALYGVTPAAGKGSELRHYRFRVEYPE